MKPRQLAALINISPATLRRWAGADYGEFLSPKGRGTNGAYRSFDEQDARILAWVALLRTQNVSVEEISATLRSAQAQQWKDLPSLPGGIVNDEPIAVVPREAVEERVHGLQERFEVQLQTVVKERDQLKSQLQTLKKRLRAARQEKTDHERELSTTIETLHVQIRELTEREALLRGQVQQYTIGGRRFNAATLVVVALLLGILLTLLVIHIR